MTPGAAGQGVEPRSLLRQVASFAPGSLVPAAVSLAVVVVFTRVFDTAAFGRYSLMLSIAALVTMILTQWLQQGIGRYLPGAEGAGTLANVKGASAASIAVLFGAILLTGAATVAVLTPVLNREWQTLLLPTLILIAGGSVMEPLTVVLQSSMRGGRYSLYRAGDALLRFSLGLSAVLLLSRTEAALLWGTALSPLLLAGIVWRDAALPSPAAAVLRLREHLPQLGRMIRYGLPMVGWFVAAYLLNVSDRYVIQLFRGAAEVGIYSASYSLAAGVTALLAAPVLLAAHPRLMQAWDAGRRGVAAHWLGRMVEMFVTAGALLVGLLLLLSADLARILMGAGFREGHVVMAIAAAGTVTWQIGILAQKPLEFTERVGVVLATALGAAVFNMGANLILVPRFGYIAAAWTTVASFALYALLTSWAGREILQWRIRWKQVGISVSIVVAGLLSAGAARGFIAQSGREYAAFAACLAVALVTSALVIHRTTHASLHDVGSQASVE
jgi:O-antigen/teichoic acid export membrane protein